MSLIRGKTIQIFLPDGNPRSVKIAEFTSRTIQSIFVPRAQLEFALSRPELSNVGIYFLVGQSEDGGLPLLYIGEAEECASRLKQHNTLKDWWTSAIICISKTAEFTKAHVKYLEWFAHEEAKRVGRYKLENGNTPPKSHIPEPVVADLMDHFDAIQTLVSTLGHPIFDQAHKPKAKNLLICKGKQAEAKGEFTEDGLVVFAGSIANHPFSGALVVSVRNHRDSLIEDGVLEVIDDDTLRFTKDYQFNSPSRASSIVLARSSNGWTEWKYSDGRTLDEVKRKGDVSG